MRPKRWFLALIRAVVVVVLTLVLAPGASAKPKFKVLQRVAGGLSGGLVFDTKGNLYGATCAGGVGANGTIFKLSRSKHWAASTLHVFDGSDGYCPNGRLIFDPQGNLYGTTALGGMYRGGEVFELSPGKAPGAAWTFSVLYSFCEQYGCPDGAPSNAGVVRDAQGNLFGTATAGANGGGVVFELSPGDGGWTYAVLHNFGTVSGHGDGASPTDALTLSASGALYGTTGAGGQYASGTVFKLRYISGTWRESLLYSFCKAGFPCEDGAGPTASVVFEASGSLYGTGRPEARTDAGRRTAERCSSSPRNAMAAGRRRSCTTSNSEGTATTRAAMAGWSSIRSVISMARPPLAG